MNDELVIKIKGSLNESLTKTEIQKQLERLEEELEEELDLTINTDQKQVKQLVNQIKQLQSEINKNAKSTVIFNEGKTNKSVQQIQGEINEIIKKYQQLGTVTSKTVFDVDTGNIKGFNLEIEKANGLVEKLNFELQRTQNGENNFKDAFVLTSKSEIDRTEKIREQQLQIEQKINKEIQQRNQNLQHQIDLFQRQAKINVQNLQRTHGGYVDNGALDQYLNSVKQLDVNTPNATQKMQSLNMQFREIQTNAKSAAGALEQSGMSLREMLSTAMTKFPVWMIASTAFYAPIRGLQDMISRLIEIDTLLTDINRVTDMSDGQITTLLNNALTTSDQLSSKLTDVLSIMGDFARLGDFNADELTEMASSAQVLTNISDLDAKGSVDALTSAMLNYNIAAKDSIRIADKLNEVDNNFAVSTLDLAQGIQKSASTAKTFGVELDTLVGYIAAIGSTTRESGSIIGNGLKTIFSRITTMSEAEDILNSVNVQVKDMQGNVRPVQDIIQDLANVWGSLSEEQQQNIGVTIAGRYQLSRFLALLNNFSLAQDATSTSINSVGSAMREQEKYADSLEGRLNRLDTAWNKLTISTGNAFLTDGIIATVEVLNDLATGLSGIIDTFGALSVIFGTVGVTTLLLSTRFRTLVTSLLFTPKAVEATKAAMIGLTTSMTRAEVATVTLKTALRGLLSATFVGGVFAAVGIVIEKLVSAISNAKQAQEEFEQSQQKSVDALTKNKEETEELINKYKELSEAKKTGDWNAEKEQEYLQIQQQLGEVFPQLIDSVDQQGQYHLKNAELIDKEIEATKELIDLKREEIRLNAEDKFAENIDERDGYFGLDKKIERRKKDIESLKSLHAEREVINKAEQELLVLENQRASNLQELAYEVMEVANAYNNIDIDPNISKQIENFILSLDLSKLDASELESFSIQVSKIMKSLQESFDSGDESKFQSTVDSFNNLIKKMGLSGDKTNSLKISYEQAKNASEQLKNATYDIDGAMDEYADSVGNAANKTDELVETYNNATSNIKSLNGVINELNEGNGISADSIGMLLEKYPRLLAYINDETALRQAVQQEIDNEANVAMQAVQQKLKTYGIDLANYKSLAEAKAAVDNQLIKTLGKNWSKYYTILGNGMVQIGGVAGDNLIRGAMQGDKEANKKLNALYSKMQSYNNIVKQVAAGFDSITLSNIDLKSIIKSAGEATDKTSKSTDNLSKSYESGIYVADQFAQKLNEINLLLEEQNALQEKLPKFSREYQESLKKELSYLEQKKNILQEQAKSLKEQINTGKIQKTGVILSGGNSVEEQIWSFFNSKGLSDSAVAGIMGNLKLESRLDPSALNKSSGAYGLAQWLGGRKKALQNYAKSVGKNVNDITTQLEFLWKELNSTEKRTLNWLLSNPNASASEAAKMFEKLFERSGGAAINKRVSYANDFYNQFQGMSSKINAENLQSIDEAKSKYNQVLIDILNIDSQIQQLNEEIIESGKAYYEDFIGRVERGIEKISSKLTFEVEGTKEYNALLEDQIAHYIHKKSLLHEEAEYLRSMINSGKLNSKQIEELTQQVSELSLAWWDVEKQVAEARYNLVKSQQKIYQNQMEEIERSLSLIQNKMNLINKETPEYTNYLREQVLIYRQKQDLLHEEAEYLRKQISSGKLYASQIEEVTKRVKELSLSWWDVEKQVNSVNEEIINMRKDTADDVVNKIKDALAKQRDITSAYYEKELKELEKVHKEKMDVIDEETKAYEDSINNKLKLLKRQRDEENYDKEVANKQKEIIKLQNQIDLLMLDNSYEANAKRKDLEEQLSQLKEDLLEYQTDREYELREQNLNDQLDAYQKDVEAKRNAEDQKYEIERDKIQKAKELNDRFYNEQIADERKWAQIREEIVSGNLENVNGLIKDYLTELKKMNSTIAEEIGISWQEVLNTIDALNKASSNLANLPLTLQETIDKMKSNSNAWFAASPQERKELEQENQKLGASIGAVYNPNDGTWSYNGEYIYLPDKIQNIASQMKSNAMAWHNADATQKKYLEEENQRLGKLIGAIYDPINGTWKYRGLPLFHKGGVVSTSGQSTNKLSRLINSLFQSKNLFQTGNNEVLAKLLEDEVVVQPRNFPNFLGNIKDMIGSLKPQPLLTDNGITINQMDVTIGSIEGGKTGVESFFKHIERNMIKRGG